ncbi:MAG: hypothetical protein J6Z27_00305 [Bacteroidales bacterium]|nr:hypothetical protein [Bacteroidales bacterium]
MRLSALYRRAVLTVATVVSMLAATSCTQYWGIEKKHGEVSRAVLIFLGGNNNLQNYMRNNLYDIYESSSLPGYTSDTVVLVFEHFNQESPRLKRCYRTDNGNVISEILTVYEESFSSATAECFAQVEKDAFSRFPARSKGLIISSHGSAWMPEGYYSFPIDFSEARIQQFISERALDEGIVKGAEEIIQGKSISSDNNNDREIDIIEWAKAINEHYEFICMDACFMSSIEVAYEMRHTADYILASPTEILAYGYPYQAVFDNLIKGGETNLKNFCSEMLDYHVQAGRTCTISLIKCSELEPLASYCKTLYAAHSAEKAAVSPYLVQPFFRYSDDWFYDFGDYVEQFVTASEYQTFCGYLNRVIIAKANTSRFLSLPINKNSGFNTYIPKARYPKLNAYYKTLEWNKATSSIGE